MKLADLLSGTRSPFQAMFARKSPTLHQGGPQSPLSRDSVDLHRTRVQTRRCSLENCPHGAGLAAAAEELHAVVPREDSITLAKRRMSHDVASLGAPAAAHSNHSTTTTSSSSTSTSSGSASKLSWHIPARGDTAAPAGAARGGWGSSTSTASSCCSASLGSTA